MIRVSDYKDVVAELELVRAEKDIVHGFVTARDGIIARMQVRIADLERQLTESRDFAVSEAAKIRTAYERQQGVLVEALKKGSE